MTKDIVWHETLVDRQDRNRRNNHKSWVVWLTGCPASGKSTIAHHMERELFDRGVYCYVLDGDNVRHGINSDLGFSREDRRQNLRRIGEVAKLVYAKCSIETCEMRDPKGQNKKARAGLIKE